MKKKQLTPEALVRQLQHGPDLQPLTDALEAFGNRRGTEAQSEECYNLLQELFDLAPLTVQQEFLESVHVHNLIVLYKDAYRE